MYAAHHARHPEAHAAGYLNPELLGLEGEAASLYLATSPNHAQRDALAELGWTWAEAAGEAPTTPSAFC